MRNSSYLPEPDYAPIQLVLDINDKYIFIQSDNNLNGSNIIIKPFNVFLGDISVVVSVINLEAIHPTLNIIPFTINVLKIVKLVSAGA